MLTATAGETGAELEEMVSESDETEKERESEQGEDSDDAVHSYSEPPHTAIEMHEEVPVDGQESNISPTNTGGEQGTPEEPVTGGEQGTPEEPVTATASGEEPMVNSESGEQPSIQLRVSTRKRVRTAAALAAENAVCADIECGTEIEPDELLCCQAPGCGLKYHLRCRGLLEKPSGNWFCDDDCKENAGFRVGGGSRKRRRH
ncbi:hypothetical protein CPC08DRAFT_729779 [Agrocybe pediades]|nr:hypothetical protein CPC08DRAFT_729779 [Agrocybe pediades]